MKKLAVALLVVVIIFAGVISVYYYYSYYPYVEDMRLNISQTRSTVGHNEHDLTEILKKSEPTTVTVRVTATLIMYSDLVFKERQRQWPIHWKFDQVLWHIFSYIHFSDNDMAMLYFAYMPSPYSRDSGIKNFSWYYFEKNADSLTREELALLVTLSYYPVKKDRVNASTTAEKARKLL